MADIESTLYSILTDASAVTDLVSTRVYPVMAAQSGSGDYVRYAKVDGQPYHTAQGAGGLRWGRFSFLCHASRWSSSKAIAAAVLSTLDGYAGTVDGVRIAACLNEEEVDLEFDDQARLYGRAVDFMIQYEE